MVTVSGLIDDTFTAVGYAPKQDKVDSRFNVPLDDFATAMYPNYVHTNYQRYIDKYLIEVARYIATGGKEGIGRLQIYAPPRHGKSLKVARLFPAWLLGNLPDTRLIIASYAARLAEKHSKFVRNLIATNRYREFFPDVRIADDTASAGEWDIAGRLGGTIAAGVGGGITGHGATLAIIDDPVKGRKEAESETIRETLHDWYSDDLSTRVEEPGGAVIVMNTRWHTDDLSGWLLQNDSAHEWTVISLPALALDNDPLGRKSGDALWEDRYPVKWLERRRAKWGEYSFASLYQQTPLPSGGGLFDTVKIEVLDYTPEVVRTVRFWDLAVTKKKHSDYSAGVKLGLTKDGRFIILDVVRIQAEFPDVQETIVQTAKIDGTQTLIRIEAEKAGIIALDTLMRDARMHPYSIAKVTPDGDKYTRALPFAARVDAGRVAIVRGAWNRAYLDELSVFPNGAHDDQVDGSSGAYGELSAPKALTWRELNDL